MIGNRKLILMFAAIALLLQACGGHSEFSAVMQDTLTAEDFIASAPEPSAPNPESPCVEATPDSSSTPSSTHQLINSSTHQPINSSTPIKQGLRFHDRIRINNIGRLRDIFNDSNHVHLKAAEKIGIQPIATLRDYYHPTRPLVKIQSNVNYKLDSLSHSYPYLVPEAARLLSDIGRDFIDSLASRGADGYRVIVTSVLRTPVTVKRLRRVNRNATEQSTHQFATTFDISYSRFECADSTRTIHEEDLKNLLAEVLAAQRTKGRCFVKFERHSACFHITTIR